MIYIIIGIIIIFLLIIFFYYEDFKIKITRYNLESKKIKDDYKIIQISDFHNRKNKWFHNQLIKIINKEKPNIIVITGDLIDIDDCTYAEKLLERIHNIVPIYFVPGNHECIFGGYPDLLNILDKYNVNVITNKCISLDNNIDIYGIKDPSFGIPNDDKESIDSYLNKFNINTKKYSILLSHRPELFDIYTKYKFDLVFTGHAHGGQVIVPLIGPLFSPHQGVLPKYARGLHKKNNTNMIVSRGLGNSLYAIIRINNRPELVIVSLSK